MDATDGAVASAMRALAGQGPAAVGAAAAAAAGLEELAAGLWRPVLAGGPTLTQGQQVCWRQRVRLAHALPP